MKNNIECSNCMSGYQKVKNSEISSNRAILDLADQLAESCRYIIEGNIRNFGTYLETMRMKLIKYNNAKR